MNEESIGEHEILAKMQSARSPVGVDELKQILIDNDEPESSDTAAEHSSVVEDELFGLEENSNGYQILNVLTKQAVPVIISFFLSVGGTFINLIFAGQYVHESGDRSAVFAGVSLANMFANVSCLSVLIGMSSAVETLGSQHNGAGNYKEVGFVLQRSCLILGFMTLPVIVLWFFTADIFLSLGVERDVCTVIRNFMRIRALSIPMDVVNESYEKYLMSIGVMRPSMWANICFNLLILAFDLLFVYGLRLNYECLAWSWVLAIYISSAVQIALSWSHPQVQRTLQPWDRRAWSGWREFVELGMPGTVMLCSEWWAYEILTMFASLLGTAQVAAQAIILQTASLAFMVPMGMGVACASLVGNSLGAGKKRLAVHIGKISLAAVLVLEILIGLLLLLGGSVFVDCFSNDARVKTVANSAIPFLCLFAVIDGLQGVCSGVLRGAGKQLVGAVANIVAFYGIGLPMAWFLCFTAHLRVNGLMMGIAVGTLFQVVVLVALILGFERYVYSSHIASALPHSVPVHQSASNALHTRNTFGRRPARRGFTRLESDDHEEDDEGDHSHSIAMVSLSSVAASVALEGDDTYVQL